MDTVDDHTPSFCRIEVILVVPCQRVILVCKKYQVMRHVTHIGAYEVAMLNQECIFELDNIHDYPLHEYCVFYQG